MPQGKDSFFGVHAKYIVVVLGDKTHAQRPNWVLIQDQADLPTIRLPLFRRHRNGG
jgi:hypothetical protein